MTTPRDDIAGLIERLRAKAEKAGREWSYYPLVTEAATQLAALSARVKEWEEHAGPYWEARALRAEQERDKAFERVAIYIEQREGHIPDWRGFVAELRRLASGPEKEIKE